MDFFNIAEFDLFVIFILSVIIGFYVISNVTPALHTPLMSITNAISSIIIVGALLGFGASDIDNPVFILCYLAILMCLVNIFGGFFVTKRMLEMYRIKKDNKNKSKKN